MGCITSPFPRDGSSFEAFENLKIDLWRSPIALSHVIYQRLEVAEVGHLGCTCCGSLLI